MDSKTKEKGPTGFVTEPRMAEHRCLWDETYPECPERLIGVIDRYVFFVLFRVKIRFGLRKTKFKLSM